MRSSGRFRVTSRWAALLAAISAESWAQNRPAIADAGTARVIVKLKAGSSLAGARALSPVAATASRAAALGARLGLPMRAGATVSDLVQVMFASGVTSAELARLVAQQRDVEYAVPDERRRIVAAPNDPLYPEGVPGNGPAEGQWYLRAPSRDIQSSLDIETAWAVTTGSPDIVVAVVDTGVRYEHPDLLEVAVGGNLLVGYDMTSDPAVANDGDGRDADASDPGDWVTQAELSQAGGAFFQCTPSPETSSWHGTKVSGLIAALTHNGIGMASAAPSGRILPVRVLGKCGGYDSDIIAGMRWAAGLSVPGVPANPHPARVINLSLGGDGACSPAYQEAVDQITAARTVIVAASGNSAGRAVAAPANCSGVIAVAGLRHVGTKVGFSALGPEVAISAPGGNCVNTEVNSRCLYPILTTTDSGTTVPVSSNYTDSFNISVGTSYSTPLVAGVAALALSLHPTLTPSQVRQLLQGTARPFPSLGSVSSSSTAPQCTLPQYNLMGSPIDQLECYCTTTTCGAGMLDAGAAVMAVVLPLSSARRPEPVPFLVTRFREDRGEFSPDRRFLAYRSNESGRSEVYVRDVSADGTAGRAKWQVSTDGGIEPRWRRDGREIFYLSGPVAESGVTSLGILHGCPGQNHWSLLRTGSAHTAVRGPLARTAQKPLSRHG